MSTLLELERVEKASDTTGESFSVSPKPTICSITTIIIKKLKNPSETTEFSVANCQASHCHRGNKDFDQHNTIPSDVQESH